MCVIILVDYWPRKECLIIATREDYLESLRRDKKRIMMVGEEIEDYVDHPMIRPSLNVVAMRYELANDPNYAELMTAKSNLTSQRVNGFRCQVPISKVMTIA